MQLLMAISISVLLMSYWVFTLNLDRDTDGAESLAVAEQMSLWHRGAHDRCVAVGCATGLVTPGTYLAPVMQAGTVDDLGYFITRYNATSGLLVTYMADGFASRGSVTHASVGAALQLEVPGQTSQTGLWNAGAGIVEPNYTPGYAPDTVITLPSPFAGGTITDGSPVIVSRLSH